MEDKKELLLRKKNKIEIGQTLESNDLYLPYKKNRKPSFKERPVIVVDRNKNDELVIVPGSKEDTPNTSYYNKYGIKYYRHNLEIVDNEGYPIKQGFKFRKTERCSKLPFDEAKKIRNIVVNHTKFSSENRQKYSNFLERNKKK